MNGTTVLVAQLAGPVFIAIGLGIYLSREHYVNVYQHLRNETLAVFMTAIAVFVGGIAIVLNQNVWSTVPEIIVSLLGWLMILKGLALTIYPRSAENIATKVAKGPFFPIVALVLILLGAYLCWAGYM